MNRMNFKQVYSVKFIRGGNTPRLDLTILVLRRKYCSIRWSGG